MRFIANLVMHLPHALLLFVNISLMLAGQAQAKPIEYKGCTVEVVLTVESPDRAWLASVNEYTCSDSWFTTNISDTVQLVHVRTGVHDDVFSLDGGGGPAARPMPRWLSPNVLEIVVPNKSLVGLQKNKFGDVAIHVKFYPDNPKERGRWLREIEKKRP